MRWSEEHVAAVCLTPAMMLLHKQHSKPFITARRSCRLAQTTALPCLRRFSAHILLELDLHTGDPVVESQVLTSCMVSEPVACFPNSRLCRRIAQHNARTEQGGQGNTRR